MENAGNMSVLMSYLPIILIVGLFYIIVLRPQGIAAKERVALLKSLTKGQTVILQAGFIGTVRSVNDKTNSLDIEMHPSGTLFTVERASVDRVVTDATVLSSSVAPAAPADGSFKKKR